MRKRGDVRNLMSDSNLGRPDWITLADSLVSSCTERQLNVFALAKRSSKQCSVLAFFTRWYGYVFLRKSLYYRSVLFFMKVFQMLAHIALKLNLLVWYQCRYSTESHRQWTQAQVPARSRRRKRQDTLVTTLGVHFRQCMRALECTAALFPLPSAVAPRRRWKCSTIHRHIDQNRIPKWHFRPCDKSHRLRIRLSPVWARSAPLGLVGAQTTGIPDLGKYIKKPVTGDYYRSRSSQLDNQT